jgi:cell division protease FtsH
MKTLAFWLGLVCVAIVLFSVMRTQPQAKAPVLIYSQFLQKVQDGQVAGVTIEAQDSGAQPATVRLKDGSAARTVLPRDARDAMAAMIAKGVDVEIRDEGRSTWATLLVSASPFLVLLGFWLFMVRRIQKKEAPGKS